MLDPEILLSQLASGLVLGGLYVLIAIGLSIGLARFREFPIQTSYLNHE